MAHLRIGTLGREGDANLFRDAWSGAAAAHQIDSVQIGGDRGGHVRDLDAMLASGALHAVSLHTPSPTRRALAIECLSRGIHVLSELPLAGDVSSSLSLLVAARKYQSILLPANKFRFSASLQLCKGILGGGGLGEPRAFALDLTPPAMPGREMVFLPVSATGLIFDLGWQALDLAVSIFGVPESIHALRASRSSIVSMPEPVRLTLRYAQGLEGQVFLSAGPGGDQNPFFSVTGADGAVQVGWKESYYQAGGEGPARLGPCFDAAEAVRQTVMSFCAVVRGDTNPWTDHANIEAVIGCTFAAQQSLETGRPVSPLESVHSALAA